MIALFVGLLLPVTAMAHEANAVGRVGTGPATTVRTLEIVEQADGKMVFSPNTIRVKRGETVRFDVTNAGKIDHEFRIDTVAGNAKHAVMMRDMPDMKHHEGNSIAISPGGSGHLSWTFTQAGTFEFACLIPGHYEAGMHGIVSVQR